MAFQIAASCTVEASDTGAFFAVDVSDTGAFCVSDSSWQFYTLAPAENWENVGLMWEWAL
jgi:hypothetical protein